MSAPLGVYHFPLSSRGRSFCLAGDELVTPPAAGLLLVAVFGLWLCWGPSVVAAGFEVGFGVNTVFGALIVHGDDARLPLGVVAWDCKTDVGDNAGVIAGNPFSYRLYQ